MPGELWPLLAAVSAIAILAGFLHSAIGFGFGIVAISLLPFVIDARAGPPIAAFALKQDWSQARYKAFITQCLLVISTRNAIVAR